jgi:hypothetical protein
MNENKMRSSMEELLPTFWTITRRRLAIKGQERMDDLPVTFLMDQ